MYIVDYEQREVVNIDQIKSISVENNRIVANFATTDYRILGHYKTAERADEVFAEMLKTCFPPNAFIMENCEINKDELEKAIENQRPLAISVKGNDSRVYMYDIGVYYMPRK